jgi:hypothetical protein
VAGSMGGDGQPSVQTQGFTLRAGNLIGNARYHRSLHRITLDVKWRPLNDTACCFAITSVGQPGPTLYSVSRFATEPPNFAAVPRRCRSARRRHARTSPPPRPSGNSVSLQCELRAFLMQDRLQWLVEGPAETRGRRAGPGCRKPITAPCVSQRGAAARLLRSGGQDGRRGSA